MPDEEDKTVALISSPAVSKAIGKTTTYMIGQPFGNLLALLIIIGFSVYFWWLQTVGQPAAVKEARESITNTTTVLTKQFSESTQAQTKVTAEALKATAEQHTKTVEKIMDDNKDSVKTMIEHSEKASQRRDADFKEREMMLREILGKPKTGAALTDGKEKEGES